jgi:hypothetical protein
MALLVAKPWIRRAATPLIGEGSDITHASVLALV